MTVILYYGDDEFMLTRACNSIISTFCQDDLSHFNVTKLIKDVRLDQLEVYLQTPSFNGGKKLIYVENPTWFMIPKVPTPGFDFEIERFKRIAAGMSTDTFILVRFDGLLDKRVKAYKAIREVGQIKDFIRIPHWDRDTLIKRTTQAVRYFNMKLDTQVILEIADRVGNDTRLLYNEVEKLSLIGDRDINIQVVQEVVDGNNYNVFKLAEYMLHGNCYKSLLEWRLITQRNEPPIKVISVLQSQFRLWFDVKLNGDKSELVANPHRLPYLIREVASVSIEKLTYSVKALYELEINLKLGTEPENAFKDVVMKICEY